MAPKYNRLIEHDDGQDLIPGIPTATSSTNVSRHTELPTRPDVYYEEGPFDPPSSDDEDEALLEKDPPSPGYAEQGNSGRSKTRHVSSTDRKFCKLITKLKLHFK